MSYYPNLSRLGWRPASQVIGTTTGGNADGKKPAAPQASHAEFPYDLITTVLTSLRNDDVEEACRAAARWCRLNKTHQKACREDSNLWATLLRTIFPSAEPVDDPSNAEGAFFRACYEWQEEKMASTQRTTQMIRSKTNDHKYEVHKNVLEFHDLRERDLSALMKRAEGLLEKSKSRGYEDHRAINDLARLVRGAIDDVYLARNPNNWHGGSWKENPEKFERLAKRLDTLVRLLQTQMDARARYLGTKPTFPDGPSAPQPMEVNASGAGPSGASSGEEEEEGEPYSSEDELATPPGFHS
tara:strand:- start:1834 stop:2730 length:897 start_codon:yes stop_codon:yes gene_type:complete